MCTFSSTRLGLRSSRKGMHIMGVMALRRSTPVPAAGSPALAAAAAAGGAPAITPGSLLMQPSEFWRLGAPAVGATMVRGGVWCVTRRARTSARTARSTVTVGGARGACAGGRGSRKGGRVRAGHVHAQ